MEQALSVTGTEDQALKDAINKVWIKAYGGKPVSDVQALASRVITLGMDRMCWVQNASLLQKEYLRIDAQLRGNTRADRADVFTVEGTAAAEAEPDKIYLGEIVATVVPGRVLQDTGRQKLVSHAIDRLDALLWVGQKAQIEYDGNGRGKVSVLQEATKEVER